MFDPAGFVAAVPPPLLWGLVGMVALLTVGALAAFALPHLRPGRDHTNFRQRVTSWWIMAALLAIALLAGWGATLALFGFISFMALREYLSLAPMRREDRPVILVAYLTIIASYAFLALHQYQIYLVFIPVYVFLVTPFLMACIGQTRAYLPTAAVIQWGIVTCVYNLGFAAYLARVPMVQAPQAGGAGLVFFLLLATEINDVAQYVWGKALGRRKIMPQVSPNKTWEGFLGGWITTAALIWFLGPVFMPIRGLGLAVMAAALPLAGFAGDVTMSAIKRDIGVKDTSRLIPGHGGVLDRIDSILAGVSVFYAGCSELEIFFQ